MSEFYITRGDRQLGPYSGAKIAGLVSEGVLAWDDLAWTDGMPEWRPLAEVYSHHADQAEVIQGAPDEEEPPGFFQALPRAFLYPFRGSAAWIILASGTILFSMMQIVTFAPIIGFIAYIFLFGYFIAFLFAVVKETAVGETEVAVFPSVANVVDDVIHPLLQFVFTVLGCMLPAIVAWFVVGEDNAELAWLPGVLVFAGLFFLPMALLVTVIYGSAIAGLNPGITIPSILRIFLRYLVIVILLAGTFLFGEYVNVSMHNSLGFLTAIPVVSFFSFYFGIVQAHILGLIYRTSSEELGWFTR